MSPYAGPEPVAAGGGASISMLPQANSSGNVIMREIAMILRKNDRRALLPPVFFSGVPPDERL